MPNTLRQGEREREGVGSSRRESEPSAVGYVRCSTDRQEQSIPDQKKAIERYATEQGLRIERFYEDDAISGTSSIGRRAFQQMLADAGGGRSRSWNIIVVYDVKRFGRVDNDEAGYYRHILKTQGVEVHYCSEGFSGGETDDLLRPVKQWQARQESKDLAKVTIRGLLSKATIGAEAFGTTTAALESKRKTTRAESALVGGAGGRGAWMGGVPPMGYDLRYENERGEFLFVLRFMRDGSKRMLDKRLKLVRVLARGESVNITKRDRAKLVLGEPVRVEVIRDIFRMYIEEGKGLRAVSDTLNSRGVETPRGPEWSARCAGYWRDSTVRAILVNPIYAGDMVWNRRTDARFFSIKGGVAVERKTAHGARLVPNAERDWIITRDAHAAIVDRRTFEKARSVREDRPTSAEQRGVPRSPPAMGGEKVVGGWNGARARFLLSGLIRCGACACKYQGVTRTKGRRRNDGSSVRNFYYACGGYIAKGRSVCTFNAIAQAALEEAVCREVMRFYGQYEGDAGRQKLKAAVMGSLGVESHDLASARTRVASEMARVETTIAQLLDNMTNKTRDLAEERLSVLREQREAARVRLEELDRLAQSEGKVAELASEIGTFVAGLGFVLAHGLNEEKQAALRRAIASIEIRDRTAFAQLRTLPLLGADDDCVRVRVALAV